MRKLILICGLLAALPAWAEDIVDVLRRSQDMRLVSMKQADAEGTRAAVVRASFEQLQPALPPDTAVELRVIRGPLWAETMHGHIVVANELLADLPESSRLFVLAHELGHVAKNHWMQTALVYQKWVPGEVTKDQTDAVASSLGREASALSYQQEFEADAFAAHTLYRLGWTQDDMLAAFMQLGAGATGDTATHPGTRKRIALLRTLYETAGSVNPP